MEVCCQFVGSVYFHPALTGREVGEENKSWIEVNVRIGNTEGMVEIKKRAWHYMREAKRVMHSDQPSRPESAETKGRERQMELRETILSPQESSVHMMVLLPGAEKVEGKEAQLLPKSSVDRNSQNSALLLAAANGDEVKVELILEEGANPDFQDKYS